jgi:cytochrome bd-type quinol oxidase subunit 1
MNIFQRIVFVLGAIALVAAILTTPLSVILQGTYAKPTPRLNELTQIELQPMITPATATMRSLGVVGATVLLVFALQGITIKKRAKKSKPKK